MIKSIQEHEDVVSKKQFCISSIVYLLAGVALFVAYSQLTAPAQSSVRLAVMVLMVVAFILGIVKLVSGKKRLILKSDGTEVKEQAFFFDPKDSMRLQTLIDQRKYADIQQLKHFKDDNSGVKLAAIFSADGKYVAIQLSEYKPFAYDAITNVKTYRGEEAVPVARCITTLSD